MAFTYGAVCRPKQGQDVSGDIYVFEEHQDTLLLAVIDGLGGGEEAAKAARGAENVIRAHPDWPLQDLMRSSHAALVGTRGAVMSILRLHASAHTADYVGVGNIGAQVYSKHAIKPISKSGIVGFRLPTLLELHYSYDSGDVFVLYSDGVSNRFWQDTNLIINQLPQQCAETILAHYGKTNDDATVAVIRVL